MKIVVPSTQVAHLWFAQSQATARTPSNNFYFEHDTIYSYGHHFPVARHIKREEVARACRVELFGQNGENKHVVLLNCNRYSNTTAGHITDVRRAIDNTTTTIFYVDNPCAGTNGHKETDARHHTENFNAMKTRVENTMKKSLTAKSRKESLLRDVIAMIHHANEYRRVFGVKVKALDDSPEAMAKLTTQLKAEKVKNAQAIKDKEKQEAEHKQAALKLFPAYLDAWQRHDDENTGMVGYQYVLRQMLCDTVHFRFADKEQTTIESSMGARVDKRDGHKLWKMCFHCHVQKCAYESNDFNNDERRISQFRLDWIDASGNCKVGCHTIKFENALQFARLAGWIENTDARV